MQQRVQGWVDEIKEAIGAPQARGAGNASNLSARGPFAAGASGDSAGMPAQTAVRAD